MMMEILAVINVGSSRSSDYYMIHYFMMINRKKIGEERWQKFLSVVVPFSSCLLFCHPPTTNLNLVL